MPYDPETSFYAENDAETLTPRGVTLRRGRADDENASFDIMRKAMGFDMFLDQHIEMRNHLRESPQCSFWIAEEMPRFSRPRAIGYARSIVRDNVFCLTEFFVIPEAHHRGIGGALLSRCLLEGKRFGADTRLVLASHNPGADSLYVRKAGCLPRLPMFLLAGPPSQIRLEDWEQRTVWDAEFPEAYFQDSPEALFASPIEPTPESFAMLERLDRTVIGFGRTPEHRYWLQRSEEGQGVHRLFRRGSQTGEIVGYGYAGTVSCGPILALRPEDQPRMLYHIATLQGRAMRHRPFSNFSMSHDFYCPIAGTNEVMMHRLLRSGWRIVFQYLYMCSRPMGRMESYICCNPLYTL